MPVDCKNFQILTKRLRLRCFRYEDVDILYKWWSDKEIMKYTPEGVYSYDTVADIIPRIVKNYQTVSSENFYAFSLLIENKDNGDKMGWCGIIRMFPFPENIEIFVGLDKIYWGQSFAEEAVRGFLGFVVDYFGFRTITALVHPENKPSLRILEKIGFSFVRTLENCPEPYQNHNGYLLYSINFDE
jgi:ribosomal-protein-alanine N-acetyltransferase